MSSNLRTTLIAVITGVWVANFVIASIFRDYRPDEYINAIFMAALGYAFTFAPKDGKKKDKDNED